MCVYILFYVTLVKKESETVVVSNITPDIYKKLYSEYAQNLLCPCTTTTIPLGNFVSKNVKIHPVCQSDFVSNQWIEGLYFANASSFILWDFRKTAYFQVCYCFIPIKVSYHTLFRVSYLQYV